MKTLYELAWLVPNDLINGSYINSQGEKCAVGWMLEQAGLTNDEIVALESPTDEELLDRVATLYGLSDSQVMDIISVNDAIDDIYEYAEVSSPKTERQLAVRRKLLELCGA